MDLETFLWSVAASILAALIIGTPVIYKITNKNKNKINKSFNSNSHNNTTNNTYFKDSSQQNNADKIVINQHVKKTEEDKKNVK